MRGFWGPAASRLTCCHLCLLWGPTYHVYFSTSSLEKVLRVCWAVPLPPSPAGTAANSLWAPSWDLRAGGHPVGWGHLNLSQICFPGGSSASLTLTPLFSPYGAWMPNWGVHKGQAGGLFPCHGVGWPLPRPAPSQQTSLPVPAEPYLVILCCTCSQVICAPPLPVAPASPASSLPPSQSPAGRERWPWTQKSPTPCCTSCFNLQFPPTKVIHVLLNSGCLKTFPLQILIFSDFLQWFNFLPSELPITHLRQGGIQGRCEGCYLPTPRGLHPSFPKHCINY